MSQPMHIFLQALAILIFISSTLTDITREQLEESFIVQMDNDYGGSCDRNLPDTEEPMLPKVLKAFDDAWTLSASAVEMPPVQIDNRLNNLDTEADFTRLRAMLFGFFGIRLTSTGDFAPDHYSEEAYDIFHGKLSHPLIFDNSASRLTHMK